MEVRTALEPCPTCGAGVRPDAPWCGLCYTPRAAAVEDGPGQEAPHPTAPAAERVDHAESVRAEAPDEAPPSGRRRGWPCGSCGQLNPMDQETCAGCGSSFLAELAGQGSPGLRLPLVGDLSRLTTIQRYTAAFLAAALVAVVVVGLVLLIGAVS